jgi:hypothetical protein
VRRTAAEMWRVMAEASEQVMGQATETRGGGHG